MKKELNALYKKSNLSQSQLLIWIGQQLNPDKPLYNTVQIFSIYHSIDAKHFSLAFNTLIAHSDAMRTVLRVIDHEPQQFQLKHISYKLEVIDFTNTSQEEIDLWIKERSQNIFNLAKPLFDSVLLKCSEQHYIWYLNIHHIITDVTSFSVMFNELGKLYKLDKDTLKNTALNLPQFKDYLKREKENTIAEKEASKRAYWQNKSNHLPNPPSLFNTNTKQNHTESERIALNLGKEKAAKIKQLCKTDNLRMFTSQMAEFNFFATILFAYLYRMGNQNHLALGTPTHNRFNATDKNGIGMFVQFFPLDVKISRQETFLGLYKKAQNETLGFFRNAYPGVANLDSKNQFNVILNYINTRFNDFLGQKTEVKWIHPGHCDPNHHLRFHVYDFSDSGEIEIHLDLNTIIFPGHRQKHVNQHFLSLIDAFIDNMEAEINQPSLLSDQEFKSIIVDPNKTEDQTILKNTSVRSLINHSVKSHPNLTAIRYENQTLTFNELNLASNKLAHFLHAKGVERGSRIGLYFSRSSDLIISLLAVLKIGATYITIPSNYPIERINFIHKDAGISMLLTNQNTNEDLLIARDAIININHEWAIIDKYSSQNLENETKASDLAYIMYTSGSTGKPKGVPITHKALLNYLSFAKSEYGFNEVLKVPLFTSIGFDLTVTSLFLPLISGGELLIYEEQDKGADLSIINVIEDNKVNFIKLTPSHLSLIKEKNFKNSELKTVIIGGENLYNKIVADLSQKIKDVNIFNEYGPTEATVGCIVHKYDSHTDEEQSVPIGLPIQNMQAYLLNDKLKPVPQGVIGNLFISGVQLTPGYINEIDNENRIVDNPFVPDTKMYNTGDLAKLNQSGELVYIGRNDRQVSIKGQRVELNEIEHILANHEYIDSCVVTLEVENHKKSYSETKQFCKKCGLPSNYPNATFNDEGVCNLCLSFESYQENTKSYFKTPEDLLQIFQQNKTHNAAQYDCILLLSGGKDSSYALGKLKEMGLSVLAYTLDNSYISEEAKDNIRRVTEALEVDHIFGKTEAMNAIFADSLETYSNVCNGCFKTIYTLSTKLALEKKIPFIITGLSRGQFFETRLTEELFRGDTSELKDIDNVILEARKAYHHSNDKTNMLLKADTIFRDDSVFDKVKFIDFYRYTDVTLSEMMRYLNTKLPWSRPSDTGRSTNCLINEVGIYIHKKREGYHNYAFPYSWDVRIGHKTREETIDEINEYINEDNVNRILKEINYDMESEKSEQYLTAYILKNNDLSVDQLKNYLKRFLPEGTLPQKFVELDQMPLTPNGKIDTEALKQMSKESTKNNYVAPSNDIEEYLVGIWEDVFNRKQISVRDGFLELGGHSLMLIKIASRIKENLKIDIPFSEIMNQSTIVNLAIYIEDYIKTNLND